MQQKSDAINMWLKKHVQTSAQVNFLVGSLCIAASLALFAISFFVLYGLVGVLFGFILPQSETLRMLLAAAGIGVLFIGNAFFKPAFTSTEVKIGNVTIPGAKSNADVAPDTFQTFVKLATNVAFCGPKVFLAGCGMITKSKRIKQMDYEGCVCVLSVLLVSKTRVPYAEIKNKIPKLDTLAVFAQMEDIDGVLFLDTDPPGLSLSENLRRELSIFIS
jgi:hypothetical protein